MPQATTAAAALFPFRAEPLDALFWAVCVAWGFFDIRFNLLHRPEGKTRVARSGEPLAIASAIGVIGCIACFEFRWGFEWTSAYLGELAPAGTAIMAAGMLLRFWVLRVLGRHFTMDVTIAEGQRVIRSGPFRVLRHPAYLGSALARVGLCVAIGSVYALALNLVVVALVYLPRIRLEEQVLVSEFGDEYVAYQRQTKKLIPFVY